MSALTFEDLNVQKPPTRPVNPAQSLVAWRAFVARFCDDVRAGRFPSSAETYHASDSVADAVSRDESTPIGAPIEPSATQTPADTAPT